MGEVAPNPIIQPSSEKAKLTVLLLTSEIASLQRMSAEDGSSVTELLKRIIRTETFLREELKKGHRILLGNSQGKVVRELVRV